MVVVVVAPPLATLFTGVPELVFAAACTRYQVPPKATMFSPFDFPGPESPTKV
jgi:hypothetical protein